MIETQLRILTESNLVFTNAFWSVVATEMTTDLNRGLGYRNSVGVTWYRFFELLEQHSDLFASNQRCFVVSLYGVDWIEVESRLNGLKTTPPWIHARFLFVVGDWTIFERLRQTFGSTGQIIRSKREWMGYGPESEMVSTV